MRSRRQIFKRYAIALFALMALMSVGGMMLVNLVYYPDPRLSLTDTDPLDVPYALRARVYAENIRQNDFETFILGSSRTKTNFGQLMDDPMLAEKQPYLITFSGPTIQDLRDVTNFIIQESPETKEIALCVDFFMFVRNPPEEFESPRVDRSLFNPEVGGLTYHLSNFFSIDDARAATSKLTGIAETAFMSQLQSMGLNPGSLDTTKDRGRVFRLNFGSYLTGGYLVRDAERLAAGIEAYEEIVKACEESGITLQAAILPSHVMHFTTIRYMDCWDLYEDWKTELVRIADASGTRIIDFSAVNEFSTEHIPEPGAEVLHEDEVYFPDAIHGSVRIGRAALPAIFTDLEAPDVLEYDTLTPNNVQQHLDNLEKQVEAYEQDNPDQVQMLTEVQELD